MLARAETERYKFKILGVTDVCRAQVGVRTGYRAACSGYGRCAGIRERVDNPRVEACALRGASERGQGDVRKLAWVRCMGARDPVQETLPSLAVCVKARVMSMRHEPRATVRRA